MPYALTPAPFHERAGRLARDTVGPVVDMQWLHAAEAGGVVIPACSRCRRRVRGEGTGYSRSHGREAPDAGAESGASQRLADRVGVDRTLGWTGYEGPRSKGKSGGLSYLMSVRIRTGDVEQLLLSNEYCYLG